MKQEPMLCGLCKKEVHPLDAHMGRINGALGVFHIDCWNNDKILGEIFDAVLRINLSKYELQTLIDGKTVSYEGGRVLIKVNDDDQ